MQKIITLAIVGIVGMASHTASAVDSNVWNPWRADMCKEGIETDVQRCYKSLYCPRGSERTNMQHHVQIRQAEFADDWKELFTTCRADCTASVNSHDHDMKYHTHR